MIFFKTVSKVFLSMQAAGNNEIAKRLFQERTVRTLERNQVLLNKIREEAVQVEVVSEYGKIETQTGVLWDSKAHDAVIERTIRGLYFHHHGMSIPADTKLSVQWLHGVPERIISKLHLFNEVVLGDQQVVYKYVIYADDPRHSLWLFDFYGAHWASGRTSPAALNQVARRSLTHTQPLQHPACGSAQGVSLRKVKLDPSIA